MSIYSEATRINPLTTYQAWCTEALVGGFVATKFVPQYSVRQSYVLTAITIFVTQWLLYTIYSVLLYPRYFSPLRHLPMVTKGNGLLTGQWRTMLKEPSGVPMRRWVNEIPNDGIIRYLHLWNRERLLVTDPKAIGDVLTVKSYEFVKPEFLRSGIGQLLGIGILFAEGEEHKIQRKNLSPAFNFRHIKELYPIFWSKAKQLAQCIHDEGLEKRTEGSIEVAGWTSRATLDIIGLAGMGQDFNALSDPNTPLNKTYRAIFRPSKGAKIRAAMRMLLPAFIFRNLPIKFNSDFDKARKLARDTSRQLIRSKKEKMEKKEAGSPDIISIALESGFFSEDKLIDAMMNFLAAGHETTASALAWTIFMLCKHPDMQTRLRDEIRAHISSFESEVDNTVIDNMPYLHAVINETLRLYPPVPLTLRDASIDTTILGQYVPRGTKVILCPWAINTSKQMWGPDADQFNPDRWMAPGQANSGGATSNYAFLTYLHGPRSCIGQKFANAELECLLAALAGKFEFTLSDPNQDDTPSGMITASPKDGLKVNLKALDWGTADLARPISLT